MGRLGMPEILVIAAIVGLLFGPKQLPKLGKSIGETIREFRGVRRELENAHEAIQDEVEKR